MNKVRRPSITRATAAAKRSAPEKYEDPLLGAVIQSKYRLIDILGRGGFGSVYHGVDEKGGSVAIKVLHQSDGDAIETFFREVKATIRVNHANIVDILDFGTYGDQLFCVMEFLTGQDLLRVFRASKEGHLPWKRVRGIVLQMCSGLYAAHNANIIHRDLKPGNIFIVKNSEGRDSVKILDFGLAKKLDDGNDDLTKTDTIKGTFKYMAPEQTLGKRDAYDHRADIYAVGIIMYELLTGEVPFKGENVFDLLEKIKHEEPKRPTLLNPEIPSYVEKIILKAIEKDPRKRYQTMKELKAAILKGNRNSKALGDLVLQDAMVKYRIATPIIHETGPLPAEELGVAIIPEEEPKAPEPAFVQNPGPQPMELMLNEEDPTREVKGGGGWFGKIILIGVLSASAGAGYYYWDRIGPFIRPYVDKAAEIMNREERAPEPAQRPPAITMFRAMIETSPGNAVVYRAHGNGSVGERIGTTKRPLIMRLENREYRFIIRKPGYRQSIITVSPQNPNARVNLRPIPRRRPEGQGGGPIDIEPVEIDGNPE